MKRFLVFSGCHYYPRGGMKDFQGDFDTIEAAKDYIILAIDKDNKEWVQIYDTQTRGIIFEKTR